MFKEAITAIEETIMEAIKAGEAKAKQSRINSEKALRQTIKESAIHAAHIEKQRAELKKEIEESGDPEAIKAFHEHEKFLNKYLNR